MRMRFFVSALLGPAAVLLAWHASTPPRQARGDPAISSLAQSAAPAAASAPQVQPVGAALGEILRSGGVTSASTPSEPAKPAVARSGDRTVAGIAEAAKRSAGGPAAKVREFTPGSKAHSEAIASIIGSPEAQRTIAPVARLYFAYFDRAPDYEGLSYYTDERDAGAPLEDIAEEFAGSLEFDRRYGTVGNAAFVDLAYRNVAAAMADPAQRDYWIGQLDSGAMTRGQLMLALSESAGFRARTGNEIFVTMAYAETLQRAPEPAELARWVEFLQAGHSRRAVIDGLLAARPRR